MKLQDKVAMVIGCGGAIGRATALRFAEEGAKVVATDPSLATAEAVTEKLEQIRGRRQARAYQLDVRNRDQIEGALAKTIDWFGHIDILVNTAGLRRDEAFHAMTEEDWDTVIEVHLKGTFNCSQLVQRYMIERNYGKIINFSSPFPTSLRRTEIANYAAATAGIEGFTKALASELGKYNINVNCIAPDFVDSAMIRDAARRVGMYLDDFTKAALPQIPLRRLGKPEEVAGVALFLASDDAGFVSGQTIRVTGGA